MPSDQDSKAMPPPPPPSTRTFAKAFSRKQPKAGSESEEGILAPYSYMRTRNFDVTAGPIGPWNRFGSHKDNTQSSQALGSDVQNGSIQDSFVPVKDIMNENNAPNNLFEARNAKLLGRASSNVVNKIGGQVVNEWERVSDDRFRHMDEYGNYVDGKYRGRPKKRKMEERQLRVQERHDELEHASTVMEEWEHLSSKEKESRYLIAKDNHTIMLKTLGIEVSEEIPEIYRPSEQQKDLSLFLDDPGYGSGDEPFHVPDDRSVDDTQVTFESSRPGASFRQQHTADEENFRLPCQPRHAKPGGPLQFRSTKETSPRDGIYGRSRISAKQKTNPKRRSTALGYVIKSTRTSDPRQHVTSRSQPPRLPQHIPFTPNTPSSIPTVPPPTTDPRASTHFAVTSWPEPTPFEDIPNHESLHQHLRGNAEKYRKIHHFAGTQGRLVTVSLAAGVTFSGEAIVSRVFGGPVQEFQ